MLPSYPLIRINILLLCSSALPLSCDSFLLLFETGFWPALGLVSRRWFWMSELLRRLDASRAGPGKGQAMLQNFKLRRLAGTSELFALDMVSIMDELIYVVRNFQDHTDK